MSKVCGIEIKSKTAYLVLLEGNRHEFRLIESHPLKIELEDASLQESIKKFSSKIQDFYRSHDIQSVFIKEGISKGKFTSGSSVFKIETLLQLLPIDVTLVKAQTLNTFLKKEELDLSNVALKKYQHMAYQMAYYGLGHNNTIMEASST